MRSAVAPRQGSGVWIPFLPLVWLILAAEGAGLNWKPYAWIALPVAAQVASALLADRADPEDLTLQRRGQEAR